MHLSNWPIKLPEAHSETTSWDVLLLEPSTTAQGEHLALKNPPVASVSPRPHYVLTVRVIGHSTTQRAQEYPQQPVRWAEGKEVGTLRGTEMTTSETITAPRRRCPS